MHMSIVRHMLISEMLQLRMKKIKYISKLRKSGVCSI